ncbi:hypothetical protein LTR62_007586 [Meristemomyces frigidus]|uniref:Uncharacterized protein n=1 Tax=Meristemomyces frigidus TaxID=1508187 RepID=A0AAN7TEF3_9PEZI|nr:hypothetical protein LTR62_007586 [Meristemomyces frigidus]
MTLGGKIRIPAADANVTLAKDLDFTETSTLDPAHPRIWHTAAAGLPAKAYRQVLGFNPFKTSYMSIYSSLNTPSDRAVACVGVLAAIAAGVPLPLIGIIFGRLIDTFPPTEDQLKTLVGELLGVAAAFFVVTAVYATAFGLTSERIALQIRERLLDCLLHLDFSYLDTHDLDITSLLSEKVDSIHAGCSEKVGIFIQSVSYFVTAFVVGFVLNARLTGILLAAIVPFLLLLTVTVRRYESKCSSRVSELSTTANGLAESALRSVKVVQAFDMMLDMCSTHSEHLDKKIRASIKQAVLSAVQIGAIYFLAYSVNGLAFYLGSHMAAADPEGGTAGTVFAVVFLILDSSLVVAQFAPFLRIFAEAARAQEIVNDLIEVRQASDKVSTAQNISPSLVNMPITISQLRFAYPARPTMQALSNLRFTIEPAKFTALVGASGGGKSTLVALLGGTYPYAGSITIGDHELRDLDTTSLRSQIAVVEQDHVLFTGTIFDNVCHGVRHTDLQPTELRHRCDQAMREAKIDFLADMEDGVHTVLGDGVALSGGQMQRVCLARALIRRPAMLILDEPTSALDAESELAIVSAIKDAVKRGVTVIMVAHRLSTVLDADSVAVFNHGAIVEVGKPTELAEGDGPFAMLLAAQNIRMKGMQSLSVDHKLATSSNGDTLSASSLDIKMKSPQKPEPNNEVATSTGSQNLYTHLRDMLKPEAIVLGFGVLASIISGAILLAEAIIFGNLIELLNAGVGAPGFQRDADFFCLMFFVVGCVGFIAWASSSTAFGISSVRTVARIQTRLMRLLLSLDLDWHATPGRSTQQLMSIFTKESGDLSCLSGPALGTILTTVTSVLGGIILALCVAWKIAVVLLAVVPIMIAAGFVRLRVVAMADTRRREAYKHATGLAAEACRKRKTVTIYGLEPYLLNEYCTALRKPFRESRTFTAWSSVIMAVSLSITYFLYALAYWWGAKQVRSGEYSTKDFFIVLPAMLFSAQSAGQLFTLSPEIARARAAAATVFKLLGTAPGMLERSSSEQMRDTRSGPPSPPAPPHSKIEFDNVSFAYSGTEGRIVLRDVSLAISSGESVAFVGPSGAGKSSTISMVERFYDPTGGSLRVDGADIRNMNVASLRAKIGLVSQDPDLLPGSIAHNIRLGSTPGQLVTDAEIISVCKSCGLHDFIQSLPETYNTECGSGSTSSRLSGGQRQRVALARALIRDPEILLLDEPTSALDAHSEQQILRALAEAKKGRTTVTVAHRLASVRDVDRIFVFCGGQVVEVGTHRELVGKGGVYAGMARVQGAV